MIVDLTNQGEFVLELTDNPFYLYLLWFIVADLCILGVLEVIYKERDALLNSDVRDWNVNEEEED